MTSHAIDELRRRDISVELVESVLRQPEQRILVRAGRTVVQSRVVIDGRAYLLRVFVDVDREPAEVVTAYRTSKIDKYWRNEP